MLKLSILRCRDDPVLATHAIISRVLIRDSQEVKVRTGHVTMVSEVRTVGRKDYKPRHAGILKAGKGKDADSLLKSKEGKQPC